MRAEDYVYVVPNLSWGASGGSTGAHCFLNQGCTQVLSGNSAGRLGSDSLCFWFRNPVLMSHGSHVMWVVTHSLKNCGLGDLAKCLPGLHFVCENKMFTGWKFLLRQASQNRWDVRHLPKWPPDNLYLHGNVMCMYNNTYSGVMTVTTVTVTSGKNCLNRVQRGGVQIPEKSEQEKSPPFLIHLALR